MNTLPDRLKRDKAALRHSLRQQRLGLSARDKTIANRHVHRQTVHFQPFQTAKHIAAYLAQDAEISPASILVHAHRSGKQLWLPRVGPRHTLSFHRYRPGDRLVRNRYGIPEPAQHTEQRELLAMDLVLVPLVACDRAGNRLGMGGGFYDRALRWIRPRLRTPLLLGLAYNFQVVDVLPSERWDRRIDAIATDERLLQFR